MVYWWLSPTLNHNEVQTDAIFPSWFASNCAGSGNKLMSFQTPTRRNSSWGCVPNCQNGEEMTTMPRCKYQQNMMHVSPDGSQLPIRNRGKKEKKTGGWWTMLGGIMITVLFSTYVERIVKIYKSWKSLGKHQNLPWHDSPIPWHQIFTVWRTGEFYLLRLKVKNESFAILKCNKEPEIAPPRPISQITTNLRAPALLQQWAQQS